MKTRKFSLNTLKVESFITSFDNDAAKTIIGGIEKGQPFPRPTHAPSVCNVSCTTPPITKGNCPETEGP